MRFLPIPAGFVPATGLRSVWRVDGRAYAIFNVEGTLYVIDDSCPHAGASLSGGHIEGRTVQCRAHGLRFDLLTGCMQNSKTFGVRAYGVEIREGQPHLVLHETSTAT